jgi:DNA-binding NarL/FixJ family response regulator
MLSGLRSTYERQSTLPRESTHESGEDVVPYRAGGAEYPYERIPGADDPQRRGSIQRVTVAIVEDQALTREGLEALLARHPDIEVAGAVVNSAGLRPILEKSRPDVVVMDIQLGQESGLKVTQWVRQHYPEVHVVILSNFDEGPMVIEAISIGASAYLLKDCSSSLLAHTIRAVTHGAVLFKKELLDRAFTCVPRASSEGTRAIARLTKGELAVLAQLSGGAGNQSIAETLIVSESTVKKRVQSIFTKLCVKNRTEAAALAIAAGLVPR